ncbi:MAG: 1-acyl-sn-glycerol-3-phosphate acyltransferase [Puniceicoccales bacterium]|jgi:1-acyl-sn-glycerol-3-phosphate acyltransferase|nr:1-acyl-sn-glycerol-3-phosphate acyltransferase [Puniceicoccales bacterium]
MLVHPVYRVVMFIAKVMFRELFDGDVYGDENIPRHGPCIIACNHLSYFDPPFIGSAVRSREVFSMARSSLFDTKFKNWLFGNMNCISLDRQSGDIGAMRSALRLLHGGKCLMIYPEGTRSHDGNAGATRAGVGMLACKTKATVVPCRIFGTFEIMDRSSKFFDWNQRATIVFGEPIGAENYMPCGESRERYRVAADTIMAAVRSLQIPKWSVY